jgi:hypothetical protein
MGWFVKVWVNLAPWVVKSCCCVLFAAAAAAAAASQVDRLMDILIYSLYSNKGHPLAPLHTPSTMVTPNPRCSPRHSHSTIAGSLLLLLLLLLLFRSTV